AHLPQTRSLHFIDTQLGSRTKPVFYRPQNPVYVVPVALKLQYGVYHMFQYFGTGYCTVFGNVAYDEYRYCRFFSETEQLGRAFPYLRYAARCRIDLRRM